MTEAIGLDAMTPDLWTHLVSEMLARGDLDMIPSALALCATHGHPEHAEYLRQVMLVGAALALTLAGGE